MFGFKALHSTESALSRVSSDIFTETDAVKSMALVLLNRSAAFDLFDHEVLLTHLKISAGTDLQYFCSYLTNSWFSVRIGHQSSSSISLWSPTGINPQAVIVFPLHFTSCFHF